MRNSLPLPGLLAALLFSGLFPAKTLAQPALARTITLLGEDGSTSLRGLSVVTDLDVWVSGSAGKVGHSVDGGGHWEWITVPNYEKRDFRDIEAFDAKT